MSLLSVINDVAARTQIPVGEFTTIIGNQDPLVRQMKAILESGGKKLTHQYRWPDLTKLFTFDLVSGQERYDLPLDLDVLITQTMWNRSLLWPIRGPLTPQQWEVIKSGVAVSEPYNRYKVQGWGAGQYFIDPIPTASEAGQTVAFEYQSVNWIRPATEWSAGLVAAAGSYCYYADNIYYTSAGGTCGSTPPTHLAGSASDGVVTWAFAVYDTFHSDTDEFILDEDDISLMLEWRFKREKGLEYQSIKDEFEDHISQGAVKKQGAAVVNFSRSKRRARLATAWQVPSSGYGS